MNEGHPLTIWTIRLALVLYVWVLAGQVWGGGQRGRWGSQRWPAVARWLWSLGCLLFLAHVVCAFHFYHGWSHAAAFADTARQTEQLLGQAFGAGIYFSYAFAALWVIDAAWWWRDLEGYARRPRGVHWAVQGYMLLIVFNGAIIFEAGVTRWVGVLVCLGLCLLLWGRFRGRKEG